MFIVKAYKRGPGEVKKTDIEWVSNNLSIIFWSGNLLVAILFLAFDT